jgi:hypothetical protein
MKLELLLDKPKFTLMFPYKNQFNRAGGSFMISLSVMILWILKHLISYNTDFTDKIIIAIVLIYVPLLLWFMGYYLFINGVKLEVHKNNTVQYYTYSSRGLSVLHYQFKLQDIKQITIKKRPFNCAKLTMKIRNPIFLEGYEKNLNKLISVSIITDKLKADVFMHEMNQIQNDKSGNQVIK